MSKRLFLLILSGILVWPLCGQADLKYGVISPARLSAYRGIPVPVPVPQWRPLRQSESCLILAGWKALCWVETERVSKGSKKHG